MRAASSLAAVLPTLFLGACAAMQQETTLETSVVLGPGGRAEGRVVVPAGSEAEIELENEGPGRADYVIRIAEGEQLATGALHEASAGVKADKQVTMVVVLETYADSGTTVGVELETSAGVNLTWDLSRAFKTVEAK